MRDVHFFQNMVRWIILELLVFFFFKKKETRIKGKIKEGSNQKQKKKYPKESPKFQWTPNLSEQTVKGQYKPNSLIAPKKNNHKETNLSNTMIFEN